MKTMKILLTCLLIGIWIGAGSVYAQNFEWAKSFGGSLSDYGVSITVDASGNVYTTGCFEGIADFDPGTGTVNLSSAGGRDFYVQKMDSSGNFLWARSFGGPDIDCGLSIKVDASGNVYTTGYFKGYVDFDPGAGTTNIVSAGSWDVFIHKMDSSGNFVWVKTIGNVGSDLGTSINVDSFGNIYTSGTFVGTVDFDPGTGIANLSSTTWKSDVFVQKMDASGNFLWAKSFGGNNSDNSASSCIDKLGNVYTSGVFQDTVDFDPGTGTANLSSVGGNDVFVQKMDASGNFLWAKTFGGLDNAECLSISIDAYGNVYTTGEFAGTVDFDPGTGTANLSSAGYWDIFIQKMDTAGNFFWAKSFGDTNVDGGASINTDAFGYVYTTGYFVGTVDFDPGPGTAYLNSIGGTDIFVQKMDPFGNFLWAKAFLGNAGNEGFSINVDAFGNVYTTGYFFSTTDFDPAAGTAHHISPSGKSDVFVQKMSQCLTTLGVDTQSACDAYTWINGITYTSSNHTATDTLTNVAGCDSIVTLNLTINTVSDTTTTTSGVLITANNPSATYQWLDCDNSYALINGETSQTFIPTTNGNFAVELTENGCVDTSACVAITTVGILENTIGFTLKVFPNPNKGAFTIDLGKVHESSHMTISDLTGKVVQSSHFKGTQIVELKLNLPAGIYSIEVVSGKKKAVKKLIIE